MCEEHFHFLAARADKTLEVEDLSIRGGEGNLQESDILGESCQTGGENGSRGRGGGKKKGTKSRREREGDNDEDEDEDNAGAYLIFVISFTQAAYLNSKFYTQKLTKTAPKHSKMPLKSKIYAFFVLNLENVTPERIFLHGHRPWCP